MCPKVTLQYKIEIKEKIIRAAIECFSIAGFDRTRMDDIAERAGLSKGTLYLYFKNKEDLFYAICQNNIIELKEQMSKLFKRKEDLASDAEKFYVNFRKTSRKGDRVFMETIAESSRNPRLRKAHYEHRIRIFEIVSKYLSQQVEKGFLRNDIDVEPISAGLVALYDGLTINVLLGINETYNRKIWTETIRALCVGIS
ncbi:MAG: TetR/AcrR family transcriptional regulator [Nitrososphaeraceae archaeon]